MKVSCSQEQEAWKPLWSMLEMHLYIHCWFPSSGNALKLMRSGASCCYLAPLWGFLVWIHFWWRSASGSKDLFIFVNHFFTTAALSHCAFVWDIEMGRFVWGHTVLDFSHQLLQFDSLTENQFLDKGFFAELESSGAVALSVFHSHSFPAALSHTFFLTLLQESSLLKESYISL